MGWANSVNRRFGSIRKRQVRRCDAIPDNDIRALPPLFRRVLSAVTKGLDYYCLLSVRMHAWFWIDQVLYST